jgi:hypothetical protein
MAHQIRRPKDMEMFVDRLGPFFGLPIILFTIGLAAGLLGGFTFLFMCYPKSVFWTVFATSTTVLLILNVFLHMSKGLVKDLHKKDERERAESARMSQQEMQRPGGGATGSDATPLLDHREPSGKDPVHSLVPSSYGGAEVAVPVASAAWGGSASGSGPTGGSGKVHPL